MNRLWVRLAFGFLLVAGVTTFIMTLLVNRQTNAQFNAFVLNNQIAASGLVEELATYYTANHGWRGVEHLLDPSAQSSGNQEMRGRNMMMMRAGMSGLTLADDHGHVIVSPVVEWRDNALPPLEQEQAVAITVDGKVVGYITATAPPSLQLTTIETAFLEQFHRSLFQGGLLAGGIAFILGILIARGLAAPLHRLAAAARQIAQGKLDHRVPARGAEEVADLAHAFNDMAESLERNERLRRNMVADIAHELRTPLTVIHGSLRALLDDVYPLEKGEIAALYDETLTLNRLINDLRELALAEAGQLTLNIAPLDLKPLLESTVDIFKTAAAEQQVQVELTLPETIPTVEADSDRVRQILHNLLSNALRYTPADGMIRIILEVPDRMARITVADTGVGIPAEQVPFVFDRFWRADQSRTRGRGGTGLGLAIARQLVEAQGGQIGVTSAIAQGSRFWFTLPTTG